MKENINTYSINLMWINTSKDGNGEYVCSGKNREGLNYELNQLKKWYVANPEAEVNFWYDSECTNNKAIENTKELLAQISSRVHLRDIREMPFVQNNSDLFLSVIPVYFRIDFLKLIISLHLFEYEKMDSVIYTDMSIGAEVEKVLSKEELFNSEAIKNLNQYGMLIGKAIHNSENQFLQMINTPELIQSLKHAINCCSFLTINTLNHAIRDQNPSMIGTLHNLPFIFTKIYIYLYLLALQSKEPIKIRADVVKEGNPQEWVTYEPSKHGYIMFGNSFSFSSHGGRYSLNNEVSCLDDIVKLPECIQLSPDISNFNSFNKAFREKVLRTDLHPSKTGSDHYWHGPLPLPTQSKEFSCMYWSQCYEKEQFYQQKPQYQTSDDKPLRGTENSNFRTTLYQEPRSLNSSSTDESNIPQKTSIDIKLSPKINTPSSNIKMIIWGGVIAVLGITAVALAFTLLNLTTLGAAGFLFIACSTSLLGLGLFARGMYKNNRKDPEKVLSSPQI